MLFSSLYNLSRYSIEWRIPEIYEDDKKISTYIFQAWQKKRVSC